MIKYGYNEVGGYQNFLVLWHELNPLMRILPSLVSTCTITKEGLVRIAFTPYRNWPDNIKNDPTKEQVIEILKQYHAYHLVEVSHEGEEIAKIEWNPINKPCVTSGDDGIVQSFVCSRIAKTFLPQKPKK